MKGAPKRRNDSWLGVLERPALLWLAARMPQWITPDRLTALGLAGAAISLVGYALAARHPAWLFLASAGLAVNWFGDSLDGSLARQRGIERPRFGYFLDNSVDLIAQFLIAVGFGLSGLVRWDLSFLALSVILMIGSLSLIRAANDGVHNLTNAGMGLTELRLALVGFNTLVVFVPPGRLEGLRLPMTYPNLLSAALSGGTLLGFLFSLVSQLRELAREDLQRAK